MAYIFTTRDGQRVEVNVAAAFDRMAAAFLRDTGCTLHVRDGSRTREEQQAEWDRYQTYGPPVAARPGTSNHEIDGPNGPRSLDLYDSGDDPGVTRFGTARDGWMQNNAGSFGFENEGNYFGEPWHKTYRGAIGGGSSEGGSFDQTVQNEQSWMQSIGINIGSYGADGIAGPDYANAVTQYQEILREYGYTGDADGIWGAGTQSAHAKLYADVQAGKLIIDGAWGAGTTRKLQSVLGVNVDGDIGPSTISALQKNLGVGVDGQMGPNTISALQKIVGAGVDGQIGPNTIKALQRYLNNGGKFNETPPTVDPGTDWSKNNPAGRNVADIQKVVGANPDGAWGPDTDAKIKAWQASKGLEADGIWGNTSDGTAFPPAGSLPGMDYSFSRPDPKKIFDAGFRHVGRYLWSEKQSNGSTNKGLSKAEYDALVAAGLKVWLIYEEDGEELLGGFDAGVRVAKAAEDYRKKLGLGNLPIYFNVDFDAQASQLDAILKALDGIASVIGLDRTGLYAGYGPIKAAFDANKIKWGFQTYAWSGGKWDTRAQLQQWSNGQWGDSVDFTRAMVAEYGQNPVGTKPTPDPDPNPQPDVWKIELPKSEAAAAGKFIDQLIPFLSQLRKLFP